MASLTSKVDIVLKLVVIYTCMNVSRCQVHHSVQKDVYDDYEGRKSNGKPKEGGGVLGVSYYNYGSQNTGGGGDGGAVQDYMYPPARDQAASIVDYYEGEYGHDYEYGAEFDKGGLDFQYGIIVTSTRKPIRTRKPTPPPRSCFSCHYTKHVDHEIGYPNCNEPFVSDGIPTVPCDGSCAVTTVLLGTDGKNYMITRSCLPDCTDTRAKDSELKCCSTHLCNGNANNSAVLKSNWSLLVISYIFTLYRCTAGMPLA